MPPIESPIQISSGDPDARWMRMALREARRALGKTYPNPAVGALIVREGEILGRGYHKRAGMPHAEAEALEDCRRRGHSPKGAEAIVTLEPCNHQGRTPPCTEALIAAGVRRVVLAARDPNRRVRGGGIERLREAGVEVREGVLEAEARELNEGFFSFHERGRPFVTLKWAMTLDGCISAASGDARWITGEQARRDAHRLRALHACVAVGIGTALADDPQLDVRMIRWNGPMPLRLIVDTHLRLPEEAAAARRPETLILATCAAPDHPRVKAWTDRGVQIMFFDPWEGPQITASPDRPSAPNLPNAPARVPLRTLLERLAQEKGVQSLFVEGGRRLAGSLFAEGLLDRAVIYLAPKLMGSGEAALGPLLGGAAEKAQFAMPLEDIRIKRLGQDIKISGRPKPRA